MCKVVSVGPAPAARAGKKRKIPEGEETVVRFQCDGEVDIEEMYVPAFSQSCTKVA